MKAAAKPITQAQAAKIIADINAIVEKHARGSTLRGLTITASCFAALLDVYAQPNENNPEGMCDDPAAFRQHFVEIITTAPMLRLRKKRRAA
jgi:hypothetical protein